MAFNQKMSAPFEAFDEAKILDTFIDIGKKIEVNDFEPNLQHCASCPFQTRCDHSCVKPEKAE